MKIPVKQLDNQPEREIEVYPGQTFADAFFQFYYQVLPSGSLIKICATPDDIYYNKVQSFGVSEKPVPCSNHEFTAALQRVRNSIDAFEYTGLKALRDSVKNGAAMAVHNINNPEL
jgi:hypothetical protein